MQVPIRIHLSAHHSSFLTEIFGFPSQTYLPLDYTRAPNVMLNLKIVLTEGLNSCIAMHYLSIMHYNALTPDNTISSLSSSLTYCPCHLHWMHIRLYSSVHRRTRTCVSYIAKCIACTRSSIRNFLSTCVLHYKQCVCVCVAIHHLSIMFLE